MTASYQGSSEFTGSSTLDTVTVGTGSAPVFTADNPPLSATGGQSYSYTFQASGSQVRNSLGSDASGKRAISAPTSPRI